MKAQHRHYVGLSGQFHAPIALPPKVRALVHIGWVPAPVWMQWRIEKIYDTIGIGIPEVSF
jgi:hypothetical protein